jgi:hypothetical protein
MKVVRSQGACRVLYTGTFHDATDVVAPVGIEFSTSSTWDELVLRRWGPAVGDPAPGINVDRPACGRILAVIEATTDGCHVNPQVGSLVGVRKLFAIEPVVDEFHAIVERAAMA